MGVRKGKFPRLFPYQRAGVRMIRDFNGRVLLGDDPGLGKSGQTLVWWRRHVRGPLRWRPVVIVCPASLKVNWEREVRKWTGRRAVVLEGMTPQPKDARWQTAPFLIANYEILRETKGRRRGKGGGVKALTALRPSTVVVDESRAVRNRAAAQSKAVVKLAARAPHVLFLDGTPVVKSPIDLYPVLNVIDPKRWPSFFDFATRYGRPRRTPWGIKYDGASHTAELQKTLRATCLVRRTKEQVLKDLPPQRREVVVLPLSDRKEYETAEREFVRWLIARGKSKQARRAAGAERLVQMGYLKRLAARLKFPALRDWVAAFLETGEKLIVFAIHHGMVTGLKTCFPAAAVVTGRVKGRDRQREFDRFNDDPKCPLLVGNLHAAGSGWSCRSASTTLMAEMDWTAVPHSQAEERVRGVGRGEKGKRSRAVYTVAERTVEERLCATLQRRQETANKVLDGDAAGGVSDILDLLEAQLLGRGRR